MRSLWAIIVWGGLWASTPGFAGAEGPRPLAEVRVPMLPGAMEGSGSAMPRDQRVNRARMQLQRKRYRSVLSETRVGLAHFPDDADLHAIRAVALCELGDFVGAAQSLSDGLGAREVSILVVVCQADALRYLGAPGEAAAARTELVVSGDSPHREQVMVMKLFEDHWMAGDLEGMWEAATTTMALNPESAVPYALMARYYTAIGDEAQAGSYLWLVQQRGGRTVSEALARIEYALAFGSPEDAMLVADEDRELVVRSMDFAVRRGQALVRAGAFDEAQMLSDVRAWRLGDELWHPGLLAVQTMAFAGIGWMEEAAQSAHRLQSAFPQLPWSREALSFWEQRKTNPAGSPVPPPR